ncbi:MAG: ATP-binding protein [Alphaproteobacteria bacterium]
MGVGSEHQPNVAPTAQVRAFANAAAPKLAEGLPEVLPASMGSGTMGGENPLAPGGLERRMRRVVPHKVFNMMRVGAGVLLAGGFLALLAALFMVMHDENTTGPVLLTLMTANMLLILVFILYIGRNVLLLLLERRGRLRKSRLPFRLLGIFSVLAVLPTILVAFYALVMLNGGLEAWFSTKVTRALEGSLQVAQAYLDEHEKSLTAEAQTLAQDPTLMGLSLLPDGFLLREHLRTMQEQRNLDEVSIYDSNGSLLASAGPSMATSEELVVTLLSNAERRPQALTEYDERQITVLAPLAVNSWLLVSRGIHPSVVARMDETTEAYNEYYALLKDRTRLQGVLTLITVLLSMAALAGAIWAGLRLAGKIVRPVTELVHATNKVSAGDLEIRLTPHDDDEMGILTQSFNRMTQQLKNNRTLVEKKNKEIDTRRRTMEAVLTGVTSGVLALDEHGVIGIVNKTARDVLGLKTGQRLEKISPELFALFTTFMQAPRDVWQQQMKVEQGGKTLTLLVRMVPQRVGGGDISAVVVTFDDVTPLLSAQKVAAWSDVARRLAHEIKNPLTPIQLCAERLRRKYMDKLEAADQPLFKEMTETIVRQTEDMRGMLNEFSDFARMPTPVFAEHNILHVLEEILLLETMGRSEIEFEKDIQITPAQAMVVCDRGQMKRVLTNVLENSVNAIHERDGDKTAEKGQIKVVVKISQGDTLLVNVLDNGRGLPEDVETEKLFDPYVTTRKKGTGLGLAIVRRVMDEHGGQVTLARRPKGGTSVELHLPRHQNLQSSAPA